MTRQIRANRDRTDAGMTLIEILVGIAAFVGLAWLYLNRLELYERTFGQPPESIVMRWLRQRNRPTTILGKNDEDVL